MKMRVYRTWTNRILLLLTICILVTGFGITYPGIVEPFTLGVLGKSLSFRLHTVLWGPFAVAVLVHLYLTSGPKTGAGTKPEGPGK
ncbi:hypothetical protein L1S32_11215 [Methanogenium sp. S4BF]|uniref:hypothetical protein n=1 Tax=Methanogenium sp. S4BF TaxID=1789226 RepID=UPI00241764BC|nr:hypothetical protein [Methanogenium sp. S4BF]WFN34395.1 hypothetical protein L1S32_11215 [Methanogenium sp. S4BF]